MSNLAHAMRGGVTRRIRHLEVVSTAAQRRARPKVVYAVIVVGGIGAILLAQLLLSIATAGGAYRISALQVQLRDDTRTQAALGEKLDVLRSTQNLTRDAEALGMVASGSPVFLDATSGSVQGSATAAGGALTGSGNAIGNALLGGSAISPAASAAPVDPALAAAGAQDTGGGISTAGNPASTAGTTTAGTGTTTTAGAAAGAGASPTPSASPSVPSAPGVLPSPTTH